LYAVTRCPSCGQLFIIYVETKRARCRYCNKTYAVRPKGDFSRVLFQSSSIEECRRYTEQKRLEV